MQDKYCCTRASLPRFGVPTGAAAAAARSLAQEMTVAALAIPCMQATCKARGTYRCPQAPG